MKSNIKYENLLPGEHKAAQVAMTKIGNAVASRLPTMNPDLQRLEGHVRKEPKGHRFGISLRLYLPSVKLVVRKEMTDLYALLADAREDLVRQVRRYLARLHHLRSLRTSIRHGLSAKRKAIESDDRLRERHALFFDVIDEHFDLLWKYAWRELAYLEANGDLPTGAFSVQDAVDAIILAGIEKFEKRSSEFNVTDWLLQLSISTLESQARQIANVVPEDADALDETAPEPATEPTESDQEFFEFYQPDDAPTLENLTPDPQDGSAEDRIAEHEAALMVHRALADLPRLWRHALMLVFVEEVPEEQVVEILGISPAELSGILEDAQRFLKARVRESRKTIGSQGDVDLQAAFRGAGKAESVRAAAKLQFLADAKPNN